MDLYAYTRGVAKKNRNVLEYFYSAGSLYTGVNILDV